MSKFKMNIQKYFFLSLLVILVGILMLPMSKKININEGSTIYRNTDTTFSEECTISIKGRYYNYLLKRDKFEGEIFILSERFTYENNSLDVEFVDGRGMLDIDLNVEAETKFSTFGDIIIDEDFDEVLILIGERHENGGTSWSGSDGKFMTISSLNRAKSIEIAIKLSQQTKWLSTNNWK